MTLDIPNLLLLEISIDDFGLGEIKLTLALI